MNTTAQSLATSDAIGSVASKLTVASGAGTAVYAASSNENIIAILSVIFTAASFVLDWFSKRRSRELERLRLENENEQQRRRIEMEREFQSRRIEMEMHDRAEQRRIMQEQFELVEARKQQESNARIAAMQSGERTIFAPDSIIGAAIDLADKGESQ